MKKLLITVTILFLPSLMASALAEEERNPFSRETTRTQAVPAEKKEFSKLILKNIHPLKRNPLHDYLLMGTITSNKGRIALVRTIMGKEYFVYEGDSIGNNEGVIKSITAEGLKIQEGEKTITLNVESAVVQTYE